MKSVKNAACCLLTLFLITALFRAFIPVNTVAKAEVCKYARADSRDIYFCGKKDLNSSLFAIPYTYCVEILSSEGEWYYVKYAEDSSLYRAVYGYCLAENLTPVSEPPETIYLNMPVTVTFRTDVPSGSLPVLNELTVTAAFYGTYLSGASAYSYVLYDGAFGYIYGAHDDYPLNEPALTSPPESGGEAKKKSANVTLIIALVLVGLAAAALLVLYFTGRRRYTPPAK